MPRKLDHKKIRAATEAVKKNVVTLAPLRAVAWASGVAWQTFRRWLERGEKAHVSYQDILDGDTDIEGPIQENPDDAVLREFYETITETLARAEIGLTARIREGKQGWQGSAWILERRRRDDYAPPSRVEVSGPSGSPISVMPVDEAVNRLMKEMAEERDKLQASSPGATKDK